MFKRAFLSILLAVFMCTGLAYAQPVEEETVPIVEEEVIKADDLKVLSLETPIDKLPPLKQGIIYSIDDQSFDYAMTTEIVEWKGLTLEGGYSVPDTLLGIISYRLGSLQQFGINVPVLNLVDVNVGYYIGWKDVNDSEESKFDHGISFTLLNIKF